MSTPEVTSVERLAKNTSSATVWRLAAIVHDWRLMKWLLALNVGLAALGVAMTGRADDSLTLADVVAAARAHAADAKEAQAKAESARENERAQIGGYLPSLRADVGGGQTWSHGYAPNPVTGRLAGAASETLAGNVGAAMSWTAWDFGRTSSAVAAARANHGAESARARAAENDAIKTASTLFLTAVFDEELVHAAEATLKLREKHANLSHALVVAGMRPPIEEARARVELLMAKLDVTKAEQQLAQDRVRLFTILQMSPDSAAVHFVRPAVLPTLTADAHRAASQALKNRPEVHAAEADVEAHTETVDLAKAQRMPSIGLSLEGRYRATKQDDDARIFPTRSVAGLVTVNIPIFDWGVWGRVSVTRADLAAAEARASGVRARVKGQAAEAAYALKGAMSLVEQAKAARELASATLAVMEARYQAGRDGPFDLFEAANKDREARTATLRAELALATATIESLAATGRLAELER